MEPVRAVMTAVQSHTIAPWKPIKYITKLIERLEDIDCLTLRNMPLLAANVENIKAYEYQGEIRYFLITIVNFLVSIK